MSTAPRAPLVALELAPRVRQRLLAAGYTSVADLEHLTPEGLEAGACRVGSRALYRGAAAAVGRKLRPPPRAPLTPLLPSTALPAQPWASPCQRRRKCCLQPSARRSRAGASQVRLCVGPTRSRGTSRPRPQRGTSSSARAPPCCAPPPATAPATQAPAARASCAWPRRAGAASPRSALSLMPCSAAALPPARSPSSVGLPCQLGARDRLRLGQ
jgi:hypothetical protein